MFKVGDEVVCVDAMPVTGPLTLKRGQGYTVTAVESCCGAAVVRLAEVGGLTCRWCNQHSHYYAWRFVKLPPVQSTKTEPEAMPIEVGVE